MRLPPILYWPSCGISQTKKRFPGTVANEGEVVFPAPCQYIGLVMGGMPELLHVQLLSLPPLLLLESDMLLPCAEPPVGNRLAKEWHIELQVCGGSQPASDTVVVAFAQVFKQVPLPFVSLAVFVFPGTLPITRHSSVR